MNETLKIASRAFSEERAVVMFPPAASPSARRPADQRPWQSSAVTLARKQSVPILPVNVQARNSGLFYWFASWNTELRDMTVFHELLNKRGKTFRLRFGPLIPAEIIAEGYPLELAARLQEHVVEAGSRRRCGVLTPVATQATGYRLTPSSACRRRRNRSSRR